MAADVMWSLRVSTGLVIPLKVTLQLERFPPIDILEPRCRTGKLRVADCEPCARIAIHHIPTDKRGFWELLYDGRPYDVYAPNGWNMLNVGKVLEFPGQRSTIQLKVCRLNHKRRSRTLRLLSIQRPQTMSETRIGRPELSHTHQKLTAGFDIARSCRPCRPCSSQHPPHARYVPPPLVAIPGWPISRPYQGRTQNTD
jgi:hypothetical protein